MYSSIQLHVNDLATREGEKVMLHVRKYVLVIVVYLMTQSVT